MSTVAVENIRGLKPQLWLPVSLRDAGFSAPDAVSKNFRMALNTGGKEKTGKTHWAIMTAPDPLGVISLDTGTKAIVDKAIAAGRKVAYRRHFAGASDEDGQAEHKKEWLDTKKSMLALAREPAVKTLVMDTGTQMWELCRLARFGKLSQVLPQKYTEVNQEMRSLIEDLYNDRPDLNLIFIHKYKKEYKANSAGKDAWTGSYEWAGFGDMAYLMDFSVEHWFDAENKRFGMTVVDTPRQNYEIVGTQLDGEDCSFNWLASLTFGADYLGA